MDQQDPLGTFREAFHLPQRNGETLIYFCGNSLGLQPKITEGFIQEELINWKENAVEGHFKKPNPWTEYHHLSKGTLANIVGAKTSEVVAMNNLTTNLHLALASFYRPEGRRRKVLIESGAFPSDFYAVHSQIQLKGFDPSNDLVQASGEESSGYLSNEYIVNLIEQLGDELALVLFPGIQYYTGQFFDLHKITQAAHNVGSYVGFDLAHAVGNVPMTLHYDEVDFAIWCTYKYLNSGPGAVGGLFIHEKHASDPHFPRLSGWWGHDEKERFGMANKINHISTVDGWQLSNSNILSHASHLASLSLFEKAGMAALREKSIKLTSYLESLILNSPVLQNEIIILTPQNPEERGCQLSLYLKNHGKSVFNYLISNGVILDWREPNVIRVAPTPFYNSFEDVYQFVQILEKAIHCE